MKEHRHSKLLVSFIITGCSEGQKAVFDVCLNLFLSLSLLLSLSLFSSPSLLGEVA